MARAASRLLLASALASLACAGRQRVAAPAPPCADVSVVGEEVRCGGRPWARVVRAACARADRFPADAFLWADEPGCRGLAVLYADGARGWVFKAPSLDPAAPDQYVPATDEEAATEWVANASLASDGSRLTFHRGGAWRTTALEFLLATRETRRVDGAIPDPRLPRGVGEEAKRWTAPKLAVSECLHHALAERVSAMPREVRVPGRALIRFAVAADGTPARYEVISASAGIAPELSRGIWDAIRACGWLPARDRAGSPVAISIVLPLRFAPTRALEPFTPQFPFPY